MSPLFLGGMPTDLDVQKLMDAFGVPEVGSLIGYDKIAEVIGHERGEGRWRSITVAWRKKLDRESNLILKAVNNEGYRVLDAKGRVDFGGRVYKSGLRRVYRASAICAKTAKNGLTEDEIRVCDHIQRVGATIRLTAASEAKKLQYPE